MESGVRLAQVCGGGDATRIVIRGNGTSCTSLGRPAAQQEAQTNEQQPPRQTRLEGAGMSARLN